MAAVLTVRELSKSFGEITAVDQIYFEIEKGEIMGLLGPNGAGKTTPTRQLFYACAARSYPELYRAYHQDTAVLSI